MPRVTQASAPKRLDIMDDDRFRAISRALADPRRYAILQQVAAVPDGIGCGALEEHAQISPATISHHLKELTDAGLLGMERDGRRANLTLIRPVWKAYLKRLARL